MTCVACRAWGVNMVSTVGDPGSHGCLVLQPNASPSWLGALILFACVAIPSLSLSLYLGFSGFWYFLPVSLAVLAGLAAGLWVGYWRTQLREVVSVEGESIAIERGHHHPEERHEFQRGWAQVVIEPADRQDHNRLYIRSHGRAVEIGAFLDDEERRDVAQKLMLLLGPGRRWSPAPGF